MCWYQEVGPLVGDCVMRVEPSLNGISVVVKETPESSLASSNIQEDSVYETESAGALISDFSL